jgi:hypothetical protein
MLEEEMTNKWLLCLASKQSREFLLCCLWILLAKPFLIIEVLTDLDSPIKKPGKTTAMKEMHQGGDNTILQ